MTLKQLLVENKNKFILYVIGALLTITGSIFATLALSNAFGIIEEHDPEQIRYRIIVTLVFALAPILIQVISRFLRIGFMKDVLIQVRTLAYQKVMTNSIESFKSAPKEQHLSTLISDINVFERDFFLSLLNIVFSFGTFLVGVLILLFIAPYIGISAFFVTIILFLVTKYYEPQAKAAKAETLKANQKYHENLTNILNGLEVITLFQVQEHFKRPFASIITVLEQVKKKAFKIDEFQSNINHWIASTYQIVVFMYATYLYVQNEITLISLIIVFNFVGQLVWSMISGFSFINRIKTSADIYHKITHVDVPEINTVDFSFEKGYKIKNLTFHYDEDLVLNNFSYDIKPKDKVLIIGPSGSGKTTLLNVLSKTLSNFSGEVLIDQKDIRTIDYLQFLNQTAYIKQQHFLFNDSIKNNIILNAKADLVKLNKILDDLDLSLWIESLEAGFDHMLINNGQNISGGQRQKISIARELYHDKEIFFVDEPSASLDDDSSRNVYEALFSLDKTIICVSHRHLDYLESYFNKVVVLDPQGASLS
ncbi:MAG: ABC transporter ATP-binding protein [Erysipelothrix sp.]|nr:ABC transporter ATP-binding protein [Erysipelothrix sp.]